MKEPKLRQWHGYLGILLSVFMILQAGSGLLISIEYMTFSYRHLFSDVRAVDTPMHEDSTSSENRDEPSPLTSMSRGLVKTLESDLIDLAHYGGDTAGHIYRIFLGLGIIVQVLTGGLIFIKIRQRRKINRARISDAKQKTAASRNELQD